MQLFLKFPGFVVTFLLAKQFLFMLSRRKHETSQKVHNTVVPKSRRRYTMQLFPKLVYFVLNSLLVEQSLYSTYKDAISLIR